jgi:hypothetical protein
MHIQSGQLTGPTAFALRPGLHHHLDYIEIFHNRQRLHQSLDYLSSVEFERRAGVS